MKPVCAGACFALAVFATSAGAADDFSLTVEGIAHGRPIPPRYALCKPDGEKSTSGENQRPTLRWQHAPAGTRSFAITVQDHDVPADLSVAGKEGTAIRTDAPRQTFYHWAVVDIPSSRHAIRGGDAAAPVAGEPLANSLGDYVENTKLYGGPCPPWNDARIHSYHFTLYALDVPHLKLAATASAKEAAEAIAAHTLAKASVTGTYTLNARLRDGGGAE